MLLLVPWSERSVNDGDALNCVYLVKRSRALLGSTTVRVWDLESGRSVETWAADSDGARRAWAAVHQGERFGAVCESGALLLKGTQADEVVAIFPGPCSSAACSPDGKHIIAGAGNGRVYLLRLHERSDQDSARS